MLQGIVSGKKTRFKKGFKVAYDGGTKRITIFGKVKGFTEPFKIDVRNSNPDKFGGLTETFTMSLPKTFTFEEIVQLISLCSGLSFKETKDCLGYTRAFECV